MLAIEPSALKGTQSSTTMPPPKKLVKDLVYGMHYMVYKWISPTSKNTNQRVVYISIYSHSIWYTCILGKYTHVHRNVSDCFSGKGTLMTEGETLLPYTWKCCILKIFCEISLGISLMIGFLVSCSLASLMLLFNYVLSIPQRSSYKDTWTNH